VVIPKRLPLGDCKIVHPEPPREPLVVSAVAYSTPVGKRYTCTDEKLKKEHLNRPAEGTAVQREFATFREFAEWRKKLDASTMLVSGTFEKKGIDGAPVLFKERASRVASKKRSRLAEAVSVSKEFLAFRSQPGILVIDIDVKSTDEVSGLYPDDLKHYEDHSDAIKDLYKVLPEAEDHALLVTDSTSANIHNAEGKRLTQAGGLRIYIPVSDASENPRVLEIIHKRCWLQGLGRWAFIDGGARFQERSLADKALGRATQPDFAAPDLGDGLIQKREWTELDGGCLDGQTVAPLTGEEENRYSAEIKKAKEALGIFQMQAKKVAGDRKVADLISKGIDHKRARKIARRLYERGVVSGADPVVFDDGKSVSAAELVADGEKYDQSLCRDPIEPDYEGGRVVGKFFWNEGFCPGVYSFARGGRWFDCHHDRDSLEEIIVTGDKDAIVSAMARTEYDDDLELVDAEAAAARELRLGNQREPLRGAINEERARIAEHRDEVRSDGDGKGNADDTLIEAGQWPLNRQLPGNRFPYSDENGSLIDHQDNLAFMLGCYGISLSYDVISKSLTWSAPGLSSDTDNADTALFSLIKSLSALNGLPKGNESLHAHLPAIAEQRQVNAVRDYLSVLSWDGVDRFKNLAETLSSHNPVIAEISIRRWLIQACAAVDSALLSQKHNPRVRPVYEYVLVMVGVQGAGKTKGLSNMVPRALHVYLKESVVLAVSNKDSIKIAVSGWIAELGELDATFRAADHVAFKAFMSREFDELRMPYAPTSSRFCRRTVFVGSVNEDKFLKDKTGSRRFYPLSVDRGFPKWSDEEVDQLWAQAWRLYERGERWWPSDQEAELLLVNAEGFRQRSWEEEKLEEMFDWEAGPDGHKRMTASKLWSGILDVGYGGKAAKPIELDNIAKAMSRLWSDQGALRENGKLMINTPEGPLQVNADGGKNRGWLVPPAPTQGTSCEGVGSGHNHITNFYNHERKKRKVAVETM